jgi:putative FmdB family regulatory protein
LTTDGRLATIATMALYEYLCPSCGARTEKRMPMSDVLQFVPCPACGAQAKKVIGNFAVVGRAEAGFGDGPAPWESGGDDEGMGGMPGMGGMGDLGGLGEDFGGHGHSHGPGGHTH